MFISCFYRDVPVGTLSALLWLAQFWESPWTSMGEGLICGSPIMIMSLAQSEVRENQKEHQYIIKNWNLDEGWVHIK